MKKRVSQMAASMEFANVSSEAKETLKVGNSIGFDMDDAGNAAYVQLVLLVYKVIVVFNKVNAAKSRVTTAVRVSTAGWINGLKIKKLIKNGKKVLKNTVGTVEEIYEPTSVEEKLDRKNEMKARRTLSMALPNKDQLKFHSYQDAKLLMEAI
nr:hypothetical protein [Tanacetum cinerariifolium]